FADDIVNARPYQFIDDAPLEERRTHAVQSRRPADPGKDGFGSLDADAIARVVDQQRPDPRDADDLHDALLGGGFLLEDEVDRERFTPLLQASRATFASRLKLWVAAERLPEVLAVHPAAPLEPPIVAPPS